MGLRAIDICTSQYFQGNSKPTLAVPVYKSMTAEQFLAEIEISYNQTEDFPEIDIYKELQLFGEGISEQPFSDLDPSTDDGEGETVFAYVIHE